MSDPGPGFLGDLDTETFRRHGREIVEWIADYFEEIERYPVLAQVAPGEIAERLPQCAPAAPEPLERILADFRESILPGITHWNHPGFLAYFANTGSAPGVLAEALIAALNVNAMLWRSSPAATELEGVVTGWLRDMMGLPAAFDGHLNDTASVGTLVALAAAREEATEGRVREQGLAGGARLRLYTSPEANSSVEKAALILGLGTEGVRKVEVDDAFRMRPEALARAVDEDRRAGWNPMAVAATVGTTSTTSIDPVPEIAAVCRKEKIWLHVDAAYGGAMAVVPEFRWVLAGTDQAESLVVNPHKWIFTPMDCSVLYCRRPETIRRAFSLVPAYLMTPEDGRARNLMDYGPALGRRFRALKLWMVLRAYGTEGIAARIREHVALAARFASWVDESPDWERLAPAPMSTVLFRHAPETEGATGDSREARLEAHNRRLLAAVNAGGRVFLSHTEVRGRFALRLAVGNIRTETRHVETAWRILNEQAQRV